MYDRNHCQFCLPLKFNAGEFYTPFDMKTENSILAIDGLSYECQYIQYFVVFMVARDD